MIGEQDTIIYPTGHTAGEGIRDNVVEPTCTEDGTKTGACEFCGQTTTITDEGTALGHDWGTASYELVADNSKVTAKHVCAREASHIETEVVNVTSKVTKPATSASDGEKKYTAVFKNPAFETQIKTEVIPASGYKPGQDLNQKGADGTEVGPGASAASADKAITGMKSDGDPKGSVYNKLKLRSTRQTKTLITLKWTRPGKATKFFFLRNKCGAKYKMRKLATYTGSSKKLTKVAGKKIKKCTCFISAYTQNGVARKLKVTVN